MEQDTGQSTRIIDISKAEFDVEDFNVTYVPEGYELVEDVSCCSTMREMIFKNVVGEGIQIHITKTDSFGANVDNERLEGAVVLVNDNEAHLFIGEKNRLIVWQMGDCTISISANLSSEELIEIASHIYVN